MKRQIRTAAIELFLDGLNLHDPYRLQRRGTDTLFVYGPDIELDWLEGHPTNLDCQILAINFTSSRAFLYIYTRYQPALGTKSMARYDYANPKYPDDLNEIAHRIIDHHNVLLTAELEEYKEYMDEQRRQGYIVITSLPERV